MVTGSDVCILDALSFTILNLILVASSSSAFIFDILTVSVRSSIVTVGVPGDSGGLLLKSYSFTTDH